MASKRVSCLMSKNEEFAVKKNIGEDAKLRNKIESLSIEKLCKKEQIIDDIKSLRHTLKDIRTSTGKSPEGIRTLSSRTDSGISEITNFSYRISENMINRSMSVKAEFSRRRSVFAEVEKCINGNSDLLSSPFEHKNDNLFHQRSLSSDGKTKSFLKHAKLDTRNVKSEGCYVQTPSSTMMKSKDFTKSFDELSSVFRDDETDIDSDNEDESRSDALAEYFRKIYNPWNIQNRNGKIYDALQLPKIKDCYRPACRSTCSTCLLRKRKGPCFLIPGLVDINKRTPFSNHLHSSCSLHTTSDSTKKKRKKGTKKKSNVSNSVMPNVPQTIVDEENSDDISSKTGDDEHSNHELVELLRLKPEPEKKISYERLKELAMPKGGYRRELRFSKSFIKRTIAKMVKRKSIEEMTFVEKENLRKIESRIRMFLAHNMQREDNRPTKMVDIPILHEVVNVNDPFTDSFSPIEHVSPPKLKFGERRVGFK